jgi:hypothetical protein
MLLGQRQTTSPSKTLLWPHKQGGPQSPLPPPIAHRPRSSPLYSLLVSCRQGNNFHPPCISPHMPLLLPLLVAVHYSTYPTDVGAGLYPSLILVLHRLGHWNPKLGWCGSTMPPTHPPLPPMLCLLISLMCHACDLILFILCYLASTS